MVTILTANTGPLKGRKCTVFSVLTHDDRDHRHNVKSMLLLKPLPYPLIQKILAPEYPEYPESYV